MKVIVLGFALFALGLGSGASLEHYLENAGSRRVSQYMEEQEAQLKLWREKVSGESDVLQESRIYSPNNPDIAELALVDSIRQLNKEIEKLTMTQQLLPQWIEKYGDLTRDELTDEAIVDALKVLNFAD